MGLVAVLYDVRVAVGTDEQEIMEKDEFEVAVVLGGVHVVV